MDRVFAHNGVVFFQLHAVRRVFAVLLRDIARSARQAAVFMLGALEDHLNAIAFAFFCHCNKYLRFAFAVFLFSIQTASSKTGKFKVENDQQPCGSVP